MKKEDIEVVKSLIFNDLNIIEESYSEVLAGWELTGDDEVIAHVKSKRDLVVQIRDMLKKDFEELEKLCK